MSEKVLTAISQAEDVAPPDHQTAMQAGNSIWRLRLAEGLFVLLCAETIFSVPYRSVYLAVHSEKLSWIAAFCVLVVVLLCFMWRETILRAVRRSVPEAWIQGRGWLVFWLVFGMVARLAWAVRFRGTLKSDGLAYFDGAKLLVSSHRYSGAYWPPGFSLFLAPFFAVFGAHVWVTLLCALLLFAATYWVTYLLAERVAGGLASRIAPALVALWPTHIALTGINCKETLLAFLIPAAMLLYLKADGAGLVGRAAFMLSAGVLIGFSALTQPGYMLFPGLILAIEWVRRRMIVRAIGRTAVFTVAVLATILPWTYRNYLAFHRVVMISTNGGSVFYRANNPKANASYAAEGEEILPKDEFAADKEGYRAAEAWIGHHPGAFAILAVRKQVVYLGDDGIGVYESLKRGLQPSARFYAAAKAVCNLFWLACWVMLLLGLPTLFRRPDWQIWYGICFLPVVYQWLVDSLFESGSRHHVPYIGLIGIMVGMVLSSAKRPELLES